MSKEINKQEMKCSEINKRIIDYLENDLSQAEKTAFEEHLPQCHDCMFIYKKVKDQWQIIEKEKQIKPDPFYFTRIGQALNNLNENETQQKHALVFRTFSTMAAVLILLISIATGIFIGSRLTESSTETSYGSDYEYYSDIMYLNSYEDEPIENYLLNRGEE